MSFKYQAQKITNNHYVLPKCGNMKVEVHAFFSEDLYNKSEEGMWSQIAEAASYNGVIGAYLMPDAHIGYGIPVGGVVVTEDTIIQSGSGYDISCFTGDTKIPLVDGRTLTLLELTELYSNGEEFYVYSITKDKYITAGKAHSPRKIRSNTKIIEVILDNGECIKCTPDHRFMLRNGEYVEAKELKENDSLMPLNKSLNKNGYCIVKHPATSAFEKMLRISFREMNGYVPEWPRVIHHDIFNDENPNQNKLNDDPRFLIDMDENDHWNLHASMAKERIKRGEIWGAKAHKLYPEMYSKMASENMTRLHADPEFKKRHSERMRKTNKKLDDLGAYDEHRANMGKRNREHIISWNKSKEGKKQSRINGLKNKGRKFTEIECEFCGQKCKGDGGLANHIRFKHATGDNHKVISVTHTDYKEDVYCLTVEKYANFALEAGVFVHNCGVVYLKVPGLHASDVASWEKRDRWVREVSKRVALGVGIKKPERMKTFTTEKVKEILRHGAKVIGVQPDKCERQYIPVPDNIDLEKLDSPYIEKAFNNMAAQMGSVGGGNHFVELQVDKNDGSVWVMIHCGSRGYGYQTADHFFRAGAYLRGFPSGKREASWLRIDEELGKEYWAHHNSAANYAIANRHTIVEGVQEALRAVWKVEGDVYYEISHNLVQEETLLLPDGTTKKGFVHRKGATRAFPPGHPDLIGTKWERTGHPVLIPGCLGQGTRILMANGFYRNIEDINVGDYVISGGGKPTEIIAIHNRGEKPTIHYRSNQFWSVTDVTPDHKHLIGDISGDRTSLYRTDSRIDILSRKNRAGESKIRWCQIGDAPRDFQLLAPRKIEYVLENPSTLAIADKPVCPSYNLGYIFGTFLGDGTSNISESTEHNWNGQINWYFGPNENKIAEKLIECIYICFKLNAKKYKNKITQVTLHSPSLAEFFQSFGKKELKHLPENLLIGHTDYLRGLFDGMIDSDGHIGGGTKKFTNTSTQCIELFGVIHQILLGYFPSISVREPSAGGLSNCNLENCKRSYRATSLKKPPLIDKYQLIDPIGLIHTNKNDNKNDFQRDLSTKEVPTYDITLAGNDPSFIANNVVVHNSMYDGAAILFPLDGAVKSGCSVNHGSGRVLARGKANKGLEHKQDHIDNEMKSVERKLGGVMIRGIVGNLNKTPLDECRHVYKNLDDVLAVLEAEGIARIAHRMYPVANLKGSDKPNKKEKKDRDKAKDHRRKRK